MTADVVVVGGGPAGAVAARRLARAGARVALVAAATVPGREGLSRRTRELLAEEGLSEAAGAAHGPVPRRGRWGDGRVVSGGEWLIDRAQLAARLRAAAAAAGVHVLADTAVATERGRDGFRIETRDGRRVHAPYLIDARGRRGRDLRGPLLLAVGRRYVRAAGVEPGAYVHPLADGWCWLATDDESTWVQLVGTPGARPPQAWLAAAAAELPALAAAIAAGPAGPAVFRPAHVRLRRPATDPNLFRVGDAALALDPLSGQGVYEALRGARAVSAAVESALDGGDAALAQRFLAERTLETFARGLATAADFYAENAAYGPFFGATAAAYRALRPPAPAVAAPAIERRAVLDHGRIRERAVLVTPAEPRGVWHVAGVPVVELLEYFHEARAASVDDAATVLARPPGAVASAVRWLARAGVVRLPPAALLSRGG